VTKEIGVDFSNLRFSLLLAHLVHELVDVATCSVSICPFFHRKSKVELLFSQLENLSDLVFLFKLDWIWNLAIGLRLLVQLQNLVEMRVKCF